MRSIVGRPTAMWVSMLSVALAVCACDAAKPPAATPAAKTASAPPAPVSEAAPNSDFPGLPADYAAARAELLRRGLVIAPDKVSKPHPQHPELDCYMPAGQCEALFLETDAEGWRRYILVKTEGAPPRVVSASSPPTAFGLSPIPPSVSSDIPRLPDDYWTARTRLKTLGYRPAKAAAKPYRVCARTMAAGEYLDCEDDTDLPEIENCAGTGAGYCTALWIAPDGRVLKITTIGEPQPGGVYHKAWAKPEDLKDLPPGWKD